MAASPDRDLGEARAALDRGDGAAALKSLDRARRGYLRLHDAEGLEHVLSMSALVEPTDERLRIRREQIDYAAKQNLRQETRRRAQQRGEPWVDPYPDLQAPTEHTRLALTRGAKTAIGIGVVLTVALLVGVILAAALTEPHKTVTVRLLNDTDRTVALRGCNDADCFTTFVDHDVAPGVEADAELDPDTQVQVFRLERDGTDDCLPLRIHDGYTRLGGAGALTARLSQATPCPGTTVLPKPAEQTPL